MTALIALLVLAASPDAGPSASVRLDGALIKPSSWSVADLKQLGPVTVNWADKSGPHQVTGVRLDRLLLKAGFAEGQMGPKVDPKLKHQGLRAALIATASDGFEAVFSVGELLETLGATNALLVWEMDGKPLPPSAGPFRLVVTTDQGFSRALYQLTSLRVVDLGAR